MASTVRSRLKRIIAVVVGTLSAISLIASALGVFLSIFIFDAPGSMQNRLLWLIAPNLWLAPILFLRSAQLALGAYRSTSRRQLAFALAFLLTPIIAIGISVGLLEVFCNGDFVCR